MVKTQVKMKWKRKAFPEIRTMPGVMKELTSLASRMASAAGPGYTAKPAEATGGRIRGRSAVVTTTSRAIRDNATRHTLSRVVSTVKKP